MPRRSEQLLVAGDMGVDRVGQVRDHAWRVIRVDVGIYHVLADQLISLIQVGQIVDDRLKVLLELVNGGPESRLAQIDLCELFA